MNDTSFLDVEAAIDRLLEAAESGKPCAPVRDLIGDDAPAAYAVQQGVVSARLARGARRVGHKIGLTSLVVQRQLGVDQPDFGVLLNDMDVSGDREVEIGRLIQPKIEAEIAFVLGRDLQDGPLDVGQVRDAVQHVVAALEIVDSRIAAWDITFADTVADNASSGLFVLGREPRFLDDFEPVLAEMTMAVDGEVVSTGTGADCLGDPLAALAWLARTARDLGDPLRAGQVVLSGALGPMVPVGPGSQVAARITGLGEVTVTISQHDKENGS